MARLSAYRDTAGRLQQSPLGVLAAVIVIAVVVSALVQPLLTWHDPSLHTQAFANLTFAAGLVLFSSSYLLRTAHVSRHMFIAALILLLGGRLLVPQQKASATAAATLAAAEHQPAAKAARVALALPSLPDYDDYRPSLVTTSLSSVESLRATAHEVFRTAEHQVKAIPEALMREAAAATRHVPEQTKAVLPRRAALPDAAYFPPIRRVDGGAALPSLAASVAQAEKFMQGAGSPLLSRVRRELGGSPLAKNS